jgi:hypothetical protein
LIFYAPKITVMPRKMRVQYPGAMVSFKVIAARVQLGTYNTADPRLHRAMAEELQFSDSAQATMGI